MKAASLIFSESVSVLLRYQQEVVADRVRDDVKAEALAEKEVTGEDPERMAALVAGMNDC